MADNDIIQTVTAPVAAITGVGVSTKAKVIAGVIVGGVILVGAYAIYALSKPKKNTLTIIKKGDSGNKSGTGTSAKTTTPAPAASTTTTAATQAVLTKGTPTAPVTAPAMADSATDFTEMASAPFAGWSNKTNGVSVNDDPIVNAGTTVSLYDTNLKSIGSTVTKVAQPLGTVWGLTAAQFYVKLDDAFVDGPDFSGASFVAVEYRDIVQPKKGIVASIESFFSADGSHYTAVLHHKNKW
jgi:hypothetical protein